MEDGAPDVDGDEGDEEIAGEQLSYDLGCTSPKCG